MVKPKHSMLPGYKRLFTSRSPPQTDRVQESFFHSTRLGPDADWHLYGNPQGTTYLHAHAVVWLRWVGRSQREADSGGWLISWTATHQLLATNRPRYYGGGLGDHREKESEKIQRYLVPTGFLNDCCGQKTPNLQQLQYNTKWTKVSVFLLLFLLYSSFMLVLFWQITFSHVFTDVWKFNAVD